MKELILQRSIQPFFRFGAGIVFLGALLDAFSNSISFFTLPRAISLTFLVLGLLALYTVLAWIGKLKWRDQNGKVLPVKKLGMAPFLYSLGCLCLIWVPFFLETKAEAPRFFGTVQSSSKAILNSELGQYPVLEIGDSGSGFVVWGAQDAPLFKFLKNSFLTIRKLEGQTKVSVQIKSRQNGIVAELVDNEWKANPEAVFDRNYNRDALEVRDKYGDVVLQLKVLLDKVQIQFKSYGATGEAVAFVKAPSGNGFLILQNPKDVEEAEIKPMFRYPSELHLGELLNQAQSK